MFAIKHLEPGDKITVLYHSRSYSSVVQDTPAPDQLVIAQPTNMGVYLDLDGDEGEVLFHKQNGIFTFRVAQQQKYVADNIPMLRLTAVSQVKRSQRRSWFRLEKSLLVQLSVKEEPERGAQEPVTIKAHTINISGGGCRIAIHRPVENGSRVECRIALSSTTELVLEGQVVWVERKSDGDRASIIGVQFADEDSDAQKRLLRYVTDEQRKQLKESSR